MIANHREKCSGVGLAQRNSTSDQRTQKAPRLDPRSLAPPMLEPPASRPRPTPRELLLVAPPVILYDAYAYITIRNAQRMEMMYDEHKCLHVDEYFHFYFTE
jgi:hypothetical protein